jgi:hypothetical protein
VFKQPETLWHGIYVYKPEKLPLSSEQEEFFQAFGYRTFIFDINAVRQMYFIQNAVTKYSFFFVTKNSENEFSS